jgi:hypothetical protein
MKSRIAKVGPWLFSLLLVPALVQARVQPVQYLSLPGTAHPLSLGASEDRQTLFVGTARHSTRDELYALDTGAAGKSLSVAWSLDLAARVNAMALEGSRIYVASSADTKELIIVDKNSRQVVGAFDAVGPADATTVELVAPGIIVLGRRRGSGPEFYRLDVNDPANIIVLDTIDDPRGARAERSKELDGYHHRGRLVGSVERTTNRGVLYYLAVTDRDAEVQVIERKVPTVFADSNGDGVYRLGCVGDSNTAAPFAGVMKWCEKLRDLIDDPDFEIVNVAVAGATVVTPNLRFDSDATKQMVTAIDRQIDAVVLAFGTNDVFQGRTNDEILAAYLYQQDVATAAGIEFFLATTPPISGCPSPSCPTITAGNALLRMNFPDRVIEFFDGFTLGYFNPDGYHLNDTGQTLRAERAFTALANPFIYNVP